MLRLLQTPGAVTSFTLLVTVTGGFLLSDPDRDQKPHFVSSPAPIVRTQTREWVLEQDFYFVDAEGKRWHAPQGTLTDGASIPQAFLSITGSPTDDAFLDAALVHDAYCDTRNANGLSYQRETWEAVHAMFYDALLAGGTTPATAKIMYAAVWLGGPRWDDPARSLENVPEASLLREYRKCVAWVEKNDPTREEIDAWMEQREAELLAEIGKES
jgi:hypothetical protein